MGVRMMKWRTRPPLSSNKFEAKIAVLSLKGLPEKTITTSIGGGGDCKENSRLGVEVKWKGSKSNNRLNFKRDNVKRNLTKEGSLGDDGFVEWNEEFVGVCDLVGFGDGCFHRWEVAFNVFDGLNQGPKRSDHVVATGSLNLADFASTEQDKTMIRLHLSVPGSIECSPILFVSLSLLKLTDEHHVTEPALRCIVPIPLLISNGDKPSTLKAGFKKIKMLKAIVPNCGKKTCREEDESVGKSSVRTEGADYPFDTDSLDETDGDDSEDYVDSSVRKSFNYESLAYANHVGGISYFNYKIKEDDSSVSMIDDSNGRISKRGIFRWRKRTLGFRSPKAKGEPLLKRDVGEEGGDDIDFDRRMLSSSDDSSYGWHRSEDGSTTSRSSFSDFGDDIFTVGKWENLEMISRDRHMKLQTHVFFASIDQRSEIASGESACTSLVATIANWFQNNCHEMPIKSELDSLIREGSLEWRNLCENQVYMKQFPDKHFDLETVLEAKTRNLAVVSEKSFIGFFSLESGVLDSLDGTMSFDNIWDEISQFSTNPRVYIVSWNDHFFVLKADHDAYYIIDTLGERLCEGCNQAYILKFDKDTTIQRLLVKETQKERQKQELVVSKGKESCKEYIKSFLAAVPLRELQTDVTKGLVAPSCPLVHRRLQIEFHYTESNVSP